MNPDAVVAILRHGDYRQPPDVPSAMLPYPLTATGFAQAESAGREITRFAREHELELADTIDSSRMLRAYQTARRIADVLAAELNRSFGVEEYDALAERSVGAAANLTVTEIEQLLRVDPRYEQPPRTWKSDSHYRLPFQGAESLIEAGLRVAAHIEAACEQCASRDQRTLKVIVGHGASLRYAAVRLGILSEAEVGNLSMFNASPIFLARADADVAGQWRTLAGDWKVRVNAGAHGDQGTS